jgi:hypothetical protein
MEKVGLEESVCLDEESAFRNVERQSLTSPAATAGT